MTFPVRRDVFARWHGLRLAAVISAVSLASGAWAEAPDWAKLMATPPTEADREALVAAAQARECRITPWDARTETSDEDTLMNVAAMMVIEGEAYVDLEGLIVISAPLCEGGHDARNPPTAEDARALFVAAGTANGCKFSGADVARLLSPLGLTDRAVTMVAQIMLIADEAEVDASDNDIVLLKTEGCVQ
jgi:hypothetical protein